MILPASCKLLAAFPFLFGILWFVQMFHLCTSRQLRFLDLDAKTPNYSQFIETLQGIRRGLNLVLDLIVAVLAVVMISVAVLLRGSTNAAFAVVALCNMMDLSDVMKASISVWTIFETSIGAVARMRSFGEPTPCENLPQESHTPPANWPRHGTIAMDAVTVAYKADMPPALDGIASMLRRTGLCSKPITECFQDVTILLIAHRLDTIVRYDKVLVLDKGESVSRAILKSSWGRTLRSGCSMSPRTAKTELGNDCAAAFNTTACIVFSST
ncbi:hypothetical protein DCS_00923 [Drechmeria coniospora]|uniref:ABC transmembrane type-1 domain-containing protein n=1 Tax=Drechmeria coniospora TaxID=98403 RepID=A0A151GRQ8_DRECN|nr:hypothetical protein DCS_00923 [Drechmeria coniospora]KYK59789.1 hypothetical protein DCS_00923 [Drechmeria coniospora]